MNDKCRDCERTPGLGSTTLCHMCRDIEGKRIAELEKEIEHLKEGGREFIWGDDHPKEFKSLRAQLSEANAAIRSFREFGNHKLCLQSHHIAIERALGG